MHILLPPSEGKTAPSDGPTLDLTRLSFPELTQARRKVLSKLIEVSGSDDAGRILKVGKRILPEVAAQRNILDMPCAPACEVYTGVLYQAARLRADDRVIIFSGLFGITTAADLIPTYRLSMNVTLPGIGSLRQFWRHELAKAGRNEAHSSNDSKESKESNAIAQVDSAESPQPTVDMRSGAYQVTAPQGQWWSMRVVDSHGNVITHAAKHYRGLLTRALLDAEHSAHSERSDSWSKEACNALCNAERTPECIDVEQVARSLGRIEVTHDGRRHCITLLPESA
ncbi:MAG: peroxide stress protein YaaA [Bifidobacterium sp.]|uniref:Peroxide stress protein YaaA n=1 Tax=Bifidobacterium fermentum TaxID=3059035 RepID=A0AB39UBD8_9BIFI